MDKNLREGAEKLAVEIVNMAGKQLTMADIAEMVDAKFPYLSFDDQDDMIVYVDYLVRHATIKVKLPKTRL